MRTKNWPARHVFLYTSPGIKSLSAFGDEMCTEKRPLSPISLYTRAVYKSHLFPLSELFLIFAVRSAPSRTGHRPGGEMVDTRDLKSLGPKRPCGFDSRPGHEGKPGNEAWLFLLFWGWQQRFGTFTFAIYCYSNSYKSLGSQPALFDGGWELPVFQVRDNQSNTNKAVPNLGTPISGQHGLLIVLFAECGHSPKTAK